MHQDRHQSRGEISVPARVDGLIVLARAEGLGHGLHVCRRWVGADEALDQPLAYKGWRVRMVEQVVQKALYLGERRPLASCIGLDQRSGADEDRGIPEGVGRIQIHDTLRVLEEAPTATLKDSGRVDDSAGCEGSNISPAPMGTIATLSKCPQPELGEHVSLVGDRRENSLQLYVSVVITRGRPSAVCPRHCEPVGLGMLRVAADFPICVDAEHGWAASSRRPNVHLGSASSVDGVSRADSHTKFRALGACSSEANALADVVTLAALSVHARRAIHAWVWLFCVPLRASIVAREVAIPCAPALLLALLVHPSSAGILACPATVGEHPTGGFVGAPSTTRGAGYLQGLIHACLGIELAFLCDRPTIVKEEMGARRRHELVESCAHPYDADAPKGALCPRAGKRLCERNDRLEGAILLRLGAAECSEERRGVLERERGPLRSVTEKLVSGIPREEGLRRQIAAQRKAVAEESTVQVSLRIRIVVFSCHPHWIDEFVAQPLHVRALEWLTEACEDTSKRHDVLVIVCGYLLP
mmetsp:Transcript_66719/g.168332  ORF Transcript_66719/g.168332 Transcript_66719/m.168332 type:complete len:529 (+) Transcript_66719:2168-3754(+)